MSEWVQLKFQVAEHRKSGIMNKQKEDRCEQSVSAGGTSLCIPRIRELLQIAYTGLPQACSQGSLGNVQIEFGQSTRREIGGSFFAHRRCGAVGSFRSPAAAQCLAPVFCLNLFYRNIRRKSASNAANSLHSCLFWQKKAKFLEIPPVKCYAIPILPLCGEE